jgi:hypothetical protein
MNDLLFRARRFVDNILTNAAAEQAAAAAAAATTTAAAGTAGGGGGGGTKEGKGGGGGGWRRRMGRRRRKTEGDKDEKNREGGPLRVLVVSHGGLLLQMLQKVRLVYFLPSLPPSLPQQVFRFRSTHKVLNAALTIVEAYPPSIQEEEEEEEEEEGGEEGMEGEEKPSTPIPYMAFSPSFFPRSLRMAAAVEEEGGREGGRGEECVFRARCVNDVAHLQAMQLVTTRSTAF